MGPRSNFEPSLAMTQKWGATEEDNTGPGPLLLIIFNDAYKEELPDEGRAHYSLRLDQ